MSSVGSRLRAPAAFPAVDGFDLSAGPEGLDDPRSVHRSRRLGSRRWTEPEEMLPEYLRREQLDREFLNTVGTLLGPAARSGEDLSPLGSSEVQLAGFCYTRTVHCECWSLRGSRGASRIRYRVSDETDPFNESGSFPVLSSTLRWPTLGKVIWMIDHSVLYGTTTGLYFGLLAFAYGEEGTDPHSLAGEINVYSEFYPQLPAWYEQATLRWADRIASGAENDHCVDSIALMAGGSAVARKEQHQ